MQYKGLPIDSESAAKMMKSSMHGKTKSDVISRQADGHIGGSTLEVPAGMSADNPFKSDKQRKFLFAKKPEVAKKFAMHGKK